MEKAQQQLHQNGFHLLRKAISAVDIDALIQNTQSFVDTSPHGVRELLNKSKFVNQFLRSVAVRNIVEPVVGKTAFPVKVIFFDKVPGVNWNVAWHQDTTIAVKEKKQQTGFDGWSEKQGVTHVQPPVGILNNILTLRIHLDNTDADNGALRVLSGSHVAGRLKSDEILKQVEQGSPISCSAEAGDVLLMRPLLVHSSRKSVIPNHRRIIHAEFCAIELPGQLQWHER